MRRLMFTVVIIVLLVWAVWAQSAPKLRWDHSGVNVTHFELVVDDGQPTNLGMPTPDGNTYEATFPTLADGVHTLVVRACNPAGCTPAVALTVVKL